MRLILSALDAKLAAAWRRACGDLDFVEVVQGSILELDCDAVVSPANSYGFMDGGIDAHFHDFFGPAIETAVRRQIYEYHHGELLVGTADIVATESQQIPYLIAAPTIRVPMKLGDTVNAYLAARAVFLLVTRGRFRSGANAGEAVAEHVRSVAMPGMGTGVGGIPAETCAKQVRAAVDHILLDRYRMPKSWAEASEDHQLLYSDKPKQLQ